MLGDEPRGELSDVVESLVDELGSSATVALGLTKHCINTALEGAVRNTAPLGALTTTIEHATIIIAGLQRGRHRLGG